MQIIRIMLLDLAGTLNCVRIISLAEIRTQKNTRLNLQPKKIQQLKILDPKKYVRPPPRHVYTRVPHLGCLRSGRLREVVAYEKWSL